MSTCVLIVEDDQQTLYPLSELLVMKGHAVVAATTAEEGLALALEHKPALIITDLALPGRSGLDLILTVRSSASLSPIPIIAISACGPTILVEAEAAGADFCLHKPIDMDTFWAAFYFAVSSNDKLDQDTEGDEESAVIEINRLIEQLRRCDSESEKVECIKQLKETLLDSRSRPAG